MGRKVFVTHEGLTLSIADHARRVGLSPLLLAQRLHAGMPLARALTLPVQAHAREGTMQWCPAHGQAIVRDITGKTVWHPVPQCMLAKAQAIATAFGCQSQIAVQHVACPQCPAQEEAA